MIIKHYNNKRERLADKRIYDTFIKEELNGNDTFEFSDEKINTYNKYDYNVFCYKGKWREYVVQKVVEDKRGGAKVYCENSVVELKNVIVTETSDTATYTAETLKKYLTGTNWHAGQKFITFSVKVKTEPVMNLYDLLRKILAAENLELETYIELQGERLVRFINLTPHVGKNNGARLEYHGRLQSLKRIYEDKDVYTAIFPIGNTVEHEKDGKPIDPDKKRAEREAEKERNRKEREQKNASVQELVVNCSALNVRPDPSTKNKPIRVLHYGDTVTSVEVKKVGSYYWARLSNGGWIRKSYTQNKAIRSTNEKAADRAKEEAERLRLEGSRRPLTITYINGSPILEDKAATQEYGIEVDGGMAARIGILKISTSKESELLSKAQEALALYKKPRAIYEANAYEEGLEGLSLGDDVVIIDDELGAELQARVIERTIEPDKKTSKIKIGNVSDATSAIANATKNVMAHTLSAVDEKIAEERKNTTRTIMSAGSWISYGTEPPEVAANGDVWYRYNPDDTIDVLVWDGEEWVLKMYDTFGKELETHIGLVEDKANAFHEDAKAFQNEISQAIKDAGFSNYADSLKSVNAKLVDLTAKSDPSQIKNVIKEEHYVTETGVHDIVSKIDVSENVKTYIETHEVVTPDSYKRFVGEVGIDKEGKTLQQKLSQIEQTQNGFQTSVADKQKKTDSRITQLAGVVDTKVSSKQMESRISQTERGISAKVTEAQNRYFDENGKPGEILEQHKMIDGEMKDLDTLSPKDWAENFPNRVVHFKTIAREEFGRLKLIMKAKKSNPADFFVENGIEKVSVRSKKTWDDTSSAPSKVIQEFRSENMHYIRESIAKDEWGDWKIAASDLMSGINVEAGGVELFSGDNKLVVSPQTTYIQDATITGAMIRDASISTAKIGTIDANIANIINITAANLAADRAAFIRALFNGIDSNLEITGDEVKMVPHSTDGFGIRYNGHSLNFYKSHRRATIVTYADGEGTIKGVLFASTFPDQSVALGCPSTNDWNEDPNKRSHFDVALEVGTDKPGVTQWGYKIHMYFDLNMHGHSIQNQSDIRLKEQIKPWDVRALDEIKKIEFIRYHWKKRKDLDRPQDTKTEQYGLSAQSIPFLTTEDANGYLNVNETKFLHLTAKGVQELEEEVSELKKENEELKKESAELKKRIERLEEWMKGANHD